MIRRRNRYGIADLLRYAVTGSEFTTVIAANFDGAQRIANVEKLYRLAEQFEKIGFLIRDFVHYVEEFEAVGGREGDEKRVVAKCFLHALLVVLLVLLQGDHLCRASLAGEAVLRAAFRSSNAWIVDKEDANNDLAFAIRQSAQDLVAFEFGARRPEATLQRAPSSA